MRFLFKIFHTFLYCYNRMIYIQESVIFIILKYSIHNVWTSCMHAYICIYYHFKAHNILAATECISNISAWKENCKMKILFTFVFLYFSIFSKDFAVQLILKNYFLFERWKRQLFVLRESFHMHMYSCISFNIPLILACNTFCRNRKLLFYKKY